MTLGVDRIFWLVEELLLRWTWFLTRDDSDNPEPRSDLRVM
jgi:hypothetical protein